VRTGAHRSRTQIKVIILFRKVCFLQARQFHDELASRQSSIILLLGNEVLFGSEMGEMKPNIFSACHSICLQLSICDCCEENCGKRCEWVSAREQAR